MKQGIGLDTTRLTPALRRAYERETLEVRGRAAEILATIGPRKLGVVALFRAERWTEVSIANYEKDQHLADLHWIRAAEWRRIGWALSTIETRENLT